MAEGDPLLCPPRLACHCRPRGREVVIELGVGAGLL